MSIWKTKKKNKKQKIDLKDLKVRLNLLIKETNLEIIHLSLTSILEEIEEKE